MSTTTNIQDGFQQTATTKKTRTFLTRIITPNGKDPVVFVQREEILFDDSGNQVGGPMPKNGIQRQLTPEFLQANPKIVELMQTISEIVDAWDAEDSGVQ